MSSIPDIYPLVIVLNRYSSRGKYLAFNCEHWEVPEPVNGGDNEHYDFIESDALFGMADTPDDAIADLLDRIRRQKNDERNGHKTK